MWLGILKGANWPLIFSVEGIFRQKLPSGLRSVTFKRNRFVRHLSLNDHRDDHFFEMTNHHQSVGTVSSNVVIKRHLNLVFLMQASKKNIFWFFIACFYFVEETWLRSILFLMWMWCHEKWMKNKFMFGWLYFVIFHIVIVFLNIFIFLKFCFEKVASWLG